jgi:hypothetical protein
VWIGTLTKAHSGRAACRSSERPVVPIKEGNRAPHREGQGDF